MFDFYEEKGLLTVIPIINGTKVNCPNLFQHTIWIKSGKYFAIWGCYQINETFNDRGLWIFGGNENPNPEKVERIVDEALFDMNLEGVDGLKENLIVRTAKLSYKTQDCCSNDTYYQKCSKTTKKSGKRVDVWIWDEEKIFIVSVVLLITVVLGLTTSVICIYSVEQ